MFFDIGVGLLFGVLMNILLGGSPWFVILFGAITMIMPDLDFLIYLYKNNWKTDQFAHEHRDLFHNPILFSGGGALILLAFGWRWSLIWLIGTVLHFIHDTLQSGFGIRWLYPFYGGYFTLVSYCPQKHIRTKTEQRRLVAKYGNPNWLGDEYFNVSHKLIVEIGIFLCGILATLWRFA